MADDYKKFLDKTFYYLNGLYTTAVERRNTAIEVSQRLEGISASMHINEHVDAIMAMHKQGTDKMREATAEAEAKIAALSEPEKSQRQAELDEQIPLWDKTVFKIKQEADDLAGIADEVAEMKLKNPFEDM